MVAKTNQTETDEVTKTCFVISPIGAVGSATRLRADKLKKYVIEKVLIERGYKVIRADDVGEPGLITNQIVKKIVECDILIADLSEHNPNVFYELAIRHGLKKPFIHIIDAKDNIPFDNAQVRTIQVDLTDLDSVESAINQLVAQVDSIERSELTTESPISVAFDLETLRTSGKPDEAILGVILEELATLRREIRAIRPSQIVRTRYNTPASWEGFVALISKDSPELGAYLANSMEVTKYKPPTVYATPRVGAEFKDVEDEVATIIKRLTGTNWEIEFLPF